MILVYTESENGIFKKNAYELLSYAKELSGNQEVIAVSFNIEDISPLSEYGVDKVVTINDEQLQEFSAKAYASVIYQVAENEQVNTILLPTSSNGKYIAPMLSVLWKGTFLPNVSSLPSEGLFKKIVFSSKAIASLSTISERKVLTLATNSFGTKIVKTSPKKVSFTPTLSADLFQIKSISKEKNTGRLSISEARIVVSGGRGLKAPENWYLIENLADSIGAATACTKPVSDMGWRPHSEHVGQTGKPVACDLYIAVGVSGAIQHLAGVNSSKVKVVINSDPEAPFFKAADYGILGDAFEILPKLTEKIKSLS